MTVSGAYDTARYEVKTKDIRVCVKLLYKYLWLDSKIYFPHTKISFYFNHPKSSNSGRFKSRDEAPFNINGFWDMAYL